MAYSLNVGGVQYVSTLATFRKSPTLQKLLLDAPTDTVPFVDRDGYAFQLVLAFLRTGQVHLAREDSSFLNAYIDEAVYYGLRPLESILAAMVAAPDRPLDMHDQVQEIRQIKKLLEFIACTTARQH
tara:strand:- start:51 stop:431 length:381 start_codon:yes stop_codon:yes gene_type:complete